MKKASLTQAGLFVLFTFCFLFMSFGSNNNNILYTITNTIKKPNHKTIVYDASKGINTKSLSKDLKQLDIFDRNGRKVLSTNKFDDTIYLNILRTGAYSIKIETNTGYKQYRKV
ncbi:hypothetical protein [Winogradskyella sp. PG-2]|uniref:hypothetical protein n=1 Tax=Winogradskyella sp. PG-2 TaxID=754409 RepID=UPI0004588905|nr:hypothetical protein [Winogradskyella sp. PG-2]BAO77531.1 hypothetical protein WPG_3301 [Winogradskyella sp. PG-2]